MRRIAAGLLGLSGFLAVWEIACRVGRLDPMSVPPPSAVFTRIAALSDASTFRADVVATVLAWLLALLITAAVAVPAGLLLGSVPAVRAGLSAITELLRPVPAVALIPLSIVLLGSGPQTKITLAVFAGVWPVLFNVVYGIRSVDPLLLDTARTCHLTRWQIAVRVRLRSVLPFALSGIRLSAGIELIVIVSTEFLAGLGYRGIGAYVFNEGQQVGDVTAVLAGTVLVGTFGYLVNGVLVGLTRRLAHAPSSATASAEPADSARRAVRSGQRWGVVIGCALLWQAVTGLLDNPFAPTPMAIATAAVQRYFAGPATRLFLGPAVWHDLVPSLVRLCAGWTVAVAIGAGLGLALGLLPALAEVVEPVCAFARAIPSTMLLPIFFVWFRVGDELEIATIAFGSMWPILLNTIDGVRAVDPVMLDTARAFATRRRRIVGRVVLPAAMPKVFAGLRISLSLAVILMVVSELVGSSNGIGYQLVRDQSLFAYPDMWAETVLLGLIGFALNAVLLGTENRVLAWHYGPSRRPGTRIVSTRTEGTPHHV